MLPIDLVLVRHGESEGNVATQRSRHGDNSAFTPEFLARHSSRFRLSALGRAQAIAAGEWLRQEFLPVRPERNGALFDRHYASEYTRALETAALLGLHDARWYADIYLCERNWGDMEVLPESERKARFGASVAMKKCSPFFWTPPNGESIAEVCARVDRVLDTLHREAHGFQRAVLVCHGEVMWAFRVRLERLSEREYKRLDLSKDPHDRIHNCQILHYSRRDPATRLTYPYANWVRSVYPLNTALSSNEWRPIVRQTFTNEELLARVGKTKPMIE